MRIEGNRFDSGPGPTFLLNDIQNVTISGNAITYCAADSGNLLNDSNNAVGIEFRDNTLHALDTPRLCVKPAS